MECDALMVLADKYMIISPVVGAGAGEISESRTSSSCFLAREDVPTVCSKVGVGVWGGDGDMVGEGDGVEDGCWGGGGTVGWDGGGAG